MRYIKLTESELLLLESIERSSDNQVERVRCQLLKLSNKGMCMKAISRLTDISWLRIVYLFNAWEKAIGLSEKVKTLRIKSGRGAKPKLQGVKDLLPAIVKTHGRHIKVILSILSSDHGIIVSKSTLRGFLKEIRLSMETV